MRIGEEISKNSRAGMHWKRVPALVGLLLAVLWGCVDPYRPPAISAPNTYLVVDGFLNGAGPSTIRLSRTQNLSDNKRVTVETKAVVQAEAQTGGSFPFTDKGDGTYTRPTADFRFGQKYRLRIKTNGGREYLSDYVTVLKTPAVDSLSWQAQGDGVQFHVSTHDPANNTRYYRWEFEETWEYYVNFFSRIEYQNGKFDVRQEDISHCWRTEKSTSIWLGSSSRLSQDVISKAQLLKVSPSTSDRLRIRYSLLVKQYALTAESYEFWQNLKKNTESLGSLFDPQPFQAMGNIHSVADPNEPVIGYLSGYSVEEKRIFIARTQLPDWRVPTLYESCEPDTIPVKDAVTEVERGLVPIDEILNMRGQVVGYSMSSEYCVDCRTRGSNVRPSYW